MKDLLELLKAKYGWLVNDYGFKISDKGKPGFFDNAFVILNNDKLNFIFTKDRDEYCLYFKFSHNSKDYYFGSYDLFKLADNSTEISHFFNDELFIREFKNSMSRIIKLFSNEALDNTILKIKELKLKNLA